MLTLNQGGSVITTIMISKSVYPLLLKGTQETAGILTVCEKRTV